MEDPDRLQETEMKLAFLERELDAYKEVADSLHDRLQRLEKQVQQLKDGEETSRTIEDFWKPQSP